MPYIELDTDILLLAAEGGDYNRREVAERISNMSAEEKQALRRAIETIDELMDADEN